MAQKKGCCIGCLLVIVLFVLSKMFPLEDKEKAKEETTTEVKEVNGTEIQIIDCLDSTGYRWIKLSYSEKMDVCNYICKEMGYPGYASSLCSQMNTFYSVNNDEVLLKTIHEVGKMFIEINRATRR